MQVRSATSPSGFRKFHCLPPRFGAEIVTMRSAQTNSASPATPLLPGKRNEPTSAMGTWAPDAHSSGGARPSTSGRNAKAFSSIVDQMNSVRSIVAHNLELLSKRGEDVQELQERTERMGESAATFNQMTNNIKTKYENKNLKLMIVLICCSCAVLIAVIIWMLVIFV